VVKYSQETVDEAVLLLDVYASQQAWRHSDRHVMLDEVGADLGLSQPATYALAHAAWTNMDNTYSIYEDAAEAAQRLREGWRP
jgi:hypothetical protein